MKTQEELIEKLRRELMDKYGDDEACVADIEESLANGDYKDLFLEYNIDGVRVCSECGKLMDDGYCINDGLEYYCSDECLHKHYTEEEYVEMYADGEGDSYWTEWYY